MKLIAIAFLFLGLQAQAQSFPSVPTQYPTESGWAVAMISMACNTDLSAIEGIEGTIEDAKGGVIYKAYVGPKLLLAAKAKNTSIFAAKVCLK